MEGWNEKDYSGIHLWCARPSETLVALVGTAVTGRAANAQYQKRSNALRTYGGMDVHFQRW